MNNRYKNIIQKYNTVIFFCIVLLVAVIFEPRFFSIRNVLNITRQISTLGIVSLGVLLVILTGGIELAVGSIMAVSSVVFAVLYPHGFLLGVMVAMLVCIALNSFSGLLVTKANVAPFVATLAMMTIGRGTALIIANGKPIQLKSTVMDIIGQESFLGIPVSFYILLVVLIFTHFFLEYTIPGRMIKAVGSNEVAARYVGIKTKFYIFIVYAMSAVYSSIGGLISSARGGVGSPILAEGFELDVIAACVVGGASLTGGKGSALQTIIGVLILGIISNLMNLMGIPGYHQQIVKGVIIALAVVGQKFITVK